MTGVPAQRQQLFGLKVDALDLTQAVDRCDQAIREHRPLVVGVVNAAKIVNLRSDSALRDSLLECDMVLADGQSVVWAGVVLRKPLPGRVTGIDLFESLLALADRDHRSIYLLGARPEVVKTLAERIGERYPGLVIAGHRDGYFSDGEAAGIAAEIKSSGADMLFLGMVSPKKEIFLGTYGHDLDVSVLHGVGGSFDVLAGLTQRAPESWQRFGMEWAYRLKQEPGRLWKRYARTNTRFIAQLAMEIVRPTPLWTRSTRDVNERSGQ